jgi:hypothetical protein
MRIDIQQITAMIGAIVATTEVAIFVDLILFIGGRTSREEKICLNLVYSNV